MISKKIWYPYLPKNDTEAPTRKKSKYYFLQYLHPWHLLMGPPLGIIALGIKITKKNLKTTTFILASYSVLKVENNWFQIVLLRVDIIVLHLFCHILSQHLQKWRAGIKKRKLPFNDVTFLASRGARRMRVVIAAMVTQRHVLKSWTCSGNQFGNTKFSYICCSHFFHLRMFINANRRMTLTVFTLSKVCVYHIN
jgi:hypothetical protein